MAEQAPAADGIRYTRFAIIRQSLKDAESHRPEGYARMVRFYCRLARVRESRCTFNMATCTANGRSYRLTNRMT